MREAAHTEHADDAESPFATGGSVPGGHGDSGQASEAGERWFAFGTALVLAVAGLASAWASFQGGMWDKLESEQYAIANSHLTESSQLLIRSGQEQAVGAVMFLQWLDAKSEKQDNRARIIENHMPPWFAGEFHAWRKRLPADLDTIEPNAPLPRFHGPSLEKAVAARQASDAARSQAGQAGENGDGYDIANVVLAMTLFLAGITSVLQSRRGKHMVLALAGVLTVAAVATILGAPRLMP